MDYLITPQEIVDICLADKNFDKAFFKNSFIEAAQEGDLRPVLTEDFYDELIQQNKDGELTPDNQAVVDLLKPALAFFVLSRTLPFVAVEITSLGLRTNVTETSQAANSAQRAELQKSCMDQAQVFIEKAIRFLEDEDNSSKYPLYVSGDNEENSVSIIGGIIFDE